MIDDRDQIDYKQVDEREGGRETRERDNENENENYHTIQYVRGNQLQNLHIFHGNLTSEHAYISKQEKCASNYYAFTFLYKPGKKNLNLDKWNLTKQKSTDLLLSIHGSASFQNTF